MPAGSGYHDYCLGYGHNGFALAFWIEASPAEVNEISYLGLQIDYVVDYVIYWTRAISLGFREASFVVFVMVRRRWFLDNHFTKRLNRLGELLYTSVTLLVLYRLKKFCLGIVMATSSVSY